MACRIVSVEYPDLRLRPLTIRDKRELALEDDKDFFLPLVAMDSAPLPWLQHDEVESERRDAQLTSQELESLRRREVESRKTQVIAHSSVLLRIDRPRTLPPLVD